MTQVGIKELKTQGCDIVRRVVEDGESVEITRRGAVVARLVPAITADRMTDEEIDRHLAELHALAARIGKRWPKGVSAVDAIRDVRRDL